MRERLRLTGTTVFMLLGGSGEVETCREGRVAGLGGLVAAGLSFLADLSRNVGETGRVKLHGCTTKAVVGA